jgi:plastocyanin
MKLFSLLLLASLVLGAAGAALASEGKLRGSVGPGFSISLRDANGATVTNLTAGAYELEVEDRSEEHNFHLTGPGVDVSTGVEQVGSQTFRLSLVDGRYTFVCDPHALSMKGAFTVGTATPPPAGGGTGGTTSGGSTAPRPSAPVGSRLVLTSGPGFTIGLRTAGGKKVTRLKPGAYTVLVRDRSGSHNARLRGAGASKATTMPFVGTQTWRVVLRKGKLTFVCDPHATSMRGSVVIARPDPTAAPSDGWSTRPKHRAG